MRNIFPIFRNDGELFKRANMQDVFHSIASAKNAAFAPPCWHGDAKTNGGKEWPRFRRTK
jgi:hypothetical protein